MAYTPALWTWDPDWERFMLKRSIALLALVALMAAPVFAADDTAPPKTTDVASQADALFKQGKIQEAHDAFAAAAKANPDDAELARRAKLLGRVLELEGMVASEDAGPDWERMVCSLHAFYHRSELPANALKVDELAHKKADSTTTAGLVLESMLELNKNAEALKFAEKLREGQFNDGNRIYRGIAQARLGKMEDVKTDLELEGMPKAKDAGVAYDLARLQALMGEKEMALATLKSSFETCPPRALAVLKGMAKDSKDLRALHGSEAFKKVMDTTSKVSADCGSCGGCDEKKEGACSGGGCAEKKDCCGSCGGGCAEKKAKTEESGCCGGCDGK